MTHQYLTSIDPVKYPTVLKRVLKLFRYLFGKKTMTARPRRPKKAAARTLLARVRSKDARRDYKSAFLLGKPAVISFSLKANVLDGGFAAHSFLGSSTTRSKIGRGCLLVDFHAYLNSIGRLKCQQLSTQRSGHLGVVFSIAQSKKELQCYPMNFYEDNWVIWPFWRMFVSIDTGISGNSVKCTFEIVDFRDRWVGDDTVITAHFLPLWEGCLSKHHHFFGMCKIISRTTIPKLLILKM